MSGPIALTPALPLVTAPGTKLQGVAIGDCTPMQQGKKPAIVFVPISWADYGASSSFPVTIAIDFQTLGPGNPLDAIRSVYIDNTFSLNPVYVFFEDTGYTVVCAPFSTIMAPVWSNAMKCKLYGNGFIDGNIGKTTYQFSNTHQSGWQSSSNLSLPNFASVQYIGAVSQAVVNSVTQTFLAVPLGTVQASRAVYIFVRSRAGTLATLNAATIGGVAATIIAQGPGSSTSHMAALFVALVPGGTTGTVVLTFSVALGSIAFFIGLDIYTAYNLTTPLVAVNSQTVLSAATTLLLPTGNNGIALAGASLENTIPSMGGIGNIIQYLSPAAFATQLGIINGCQNTIGASLSPSVSGSGSKRFIVASFV